jgi:hypothetical protein
MSTATPVPVRPALTRYGATRVGLIVLMTVNAILIAAALAIALLSGSAPAPTPGPQPAPAPAPAPTGPVGE